jgi:hypothetical protein
VCPGGDDRQARPDLGVAVQQLEAGVLEVEPVIERGRLAQAPVKLGPLHVKGRMLEHRVLAAVVEEQVRVDDQVDAAGD